MQRTARQLFIRSSIVCALLGALLFGIALKRIEPLPLSQAPLQFNPKQAHAYMTQLAKGFPYRTTWSDSRRRATKWLKSEFRKLGYEPQGMLFSEMIDGKEYTDLENVYAEKRGTRKPDEIILVLAHYDVSERTVEGATDDAAGVGVVLELARLFAQEPTDRTIVFLATDSEEFGYLWGARAFAQKFPRADQIVAAANFDFPAPERQTKILTLSDGLKAGFTPLWLRELAINSVRSVGTVEALDLRNVVEHVQRAIQIPAADHGALLAAGIPAFNYAGQTDDLAYQLAHYLHTPDDAAEAVEAETFASYGKAAERLIRSVDRLPALPADYRNSSYWKITETTYLEGWATFLLHVLAFVPFLVFSLSKFGSTLKRASGAQIRDFLRNEAKHLGIVIGSLLLGYGVLLLLPILRIITRYEIFPATQKSLLLYSPDFGAISLVLGAGLAVYWIFARLFRAPADEHHHLPAASDSPVSPVEIRHALHAALLTLIIILAFFKNSYLATLMLLPPAYSWTALRVRKRREDRLINLILLAGGLTTFVVIIVALNKIFHIGVPYWYIFLASAYGLFSAYAVILGLMTLAIMVRLLRAFVI